MTIREHLQAIYDERGELTPELVVGVARDPGHPLHAHVFHVAPEEAAGLWYRHRAHELIQSVRIVYRDADDKPLDVRAWHAVPREEGGYRYEPAEKIARDDFSRKIVLRDMEREWRTLRGRYEAFDQFWRLVVGDVPPGQLIASEDGELAAAAD